MKDFKFASAALCVPILLAAALCGCTRREESSAKVGDIVVLGRWEQDGDSSNGAEEIEWLVLEAEGGEALVISEYGLDCLPFNETQTETTWENCTLRHHLNGDFYNRAFSADEKRRIVKSRVEARPDAHFEADQGAGTEDFVFLPAIEDGEKFFAEGGFFADGDGAICRATLYAERRGALADDVGNCLWWLRSSGFSNLGAVYVDGRGSLQSGIVDNTDKAVRPMLRVKLP